MLLCYHLCSIVDLTFGPLVCLWALVTLAVPGLVPFGEMPFSYGASRDNLSLIARDSNAIICQLCKRKKMPEMGTLGPGNSLTRYTITNLPSMRHSPIKVLTPWIAS